MSEDRGPKFFLNIEGTLHPWNRPTVTTEEVAQVGGWDPSQGVILIDADNNERVLAPGEVIQLHPGMGFAKRIRWRRGLQPTGRIEEELEILRQQFPGIEYVSEGQWVCIPGYKRTPGWMPSESDVAFQIPIAFPGTPPYGFYIPAGSLFNGAAPQNYAEGGDPRPPFPGVWGKFSWQVDSGDWQPRSTARAGSNLLSWARGIAARFRDGA